MSDKKTSKSAPKTDAGNKNKTPTVIGPDGKERPVCSGEVLKEIDGKVVALPKDEAAKDVLKAKKMLISVYNNEAGLSVFGLTVKHCNNGNLLLSIETAGGNDSTFHMPTKEQCKYMPDPRGMRVVGRLANMEAMYAMTSCYEAYTLNLNLTNAYALVRLELQDIGNGEGVKWYGLFVPALKVMEA